MMVSHGIPGEQIGKVRRRPLLAAAAASVVGFPFLASATTPKKPVRIGWTDWADAEAITLLTWAILEQQMGYKVELVKAGIAQQFQGVADGSLDLMMMCWLPNTHKSYWEAAAPQVIDLGPVYQGCKIGWIVPNSVPTFELGSIDDLAKPAVREKLGGRIHGIELGTGLMKASAKALEDYRLGGYELVTGTDQAMVAAIDKAVVERHWTVAASWTPHYMFSKYNLRYLKDPKGVFGGSERVHALARSGIENDHPQVAALVRQIRLTASELEALMYITQMQVFRGNSRHTTGERTAAMWIKG
ncbi:MAG TPA: glycine betaine ABC transporter substrate-binding protein, partial [Hydrogenophaga sp.]|nr:glycine betaine ABC transporter substrate-binding protein [Hydrogenophaga sp.]